MWLKHGDTLLRHSSVLAGYALVGYWQSVTHPPRFDGVVKAVKDKMKAEIIPKQEIQIQFGSSKRTG